VGSTKDGEGKGLFHVVGLASNVYECLPRPFEEGLRLAKEVGLRVTVHCDVDEKDVGEHIREGIFEVCAGAGVDRIDYGLNAIDFPELIAGLKARGIGLTLCLHAYHRRQAMAVLFPKIRRLWDEGVRFCINSDDPTYMYDNWIDDWIDGNMMKMYRYCRFPKLEMEKLVQNAVEMSLADMDAKNAILKKSGVLAAEGSPANQQPVSYIPTYYMLKFYMAPMIHSIIHHHAMELSTEHSGPSQNLISSSSLFIGGRIFGRSGPVVKSPPIFNRPSVALWRQKQVTI
jgi:hypothetical protein